MILYLDTTERDSFTLAWVTRQGIEYQKTVPSVRAHAEKLLKAINTLLNPSPSQGEVGLPASGGVRVGGVKKIKGIAVVKGPGSFTSLRIGIATANALGFALGVPVLGLSKPLTGTKAEIGKLLKSLSSGKKMTFVLPKYGRAPYITTPPSPSPY